MGPGNLSFRASEHEGWDSPFSGIKLLFINHLEDELLMAAYAWIGDRLRYKSLSSPSSYDPQEAWNDLVNELEMERKEISLMN